MPSFSLNRFPTWGSGGLILFIINDFTYWKLAFLYDSVRVANCNNVSSISNVYDHPSFGWTIHALWMLRQLPKRSHRKMRLSIRLLDSKWVTFKLCVYFKIQTLHYFSRHWPITAQKATMRSYYCCHIQSTVLNTAIIFFARNFRDSHSASVSG